MAKLQCKVCGGKLSIDADGKNSECLSCGMTYTQEVIQQMLGTAEAPVHITGEIKVEGIADLEKLLDDADLRMQEVDRAAAKNNIDVDSPAAHGNRKRREKRQEECLSMVMSYLGVQLHYETIMRKYPRDVRPIIGYLKANTQTTIWQILRGTYGEEMIRPIEKIRDEPPVGITNPEDIKKIKAVSNECLEKIRATLERRNIPSGGCYIATAVYGDYEAPQVLALRRFRDEVLLKSKAGQTFVSFYYKHSPRFAEKLKNHKRANRLVRFILDGVVRILEKTRNR